MHGRMRTASAGCSSSSQSKSLLQNPSAWAGASPPTSEHLGPAGSRRFDSVRSAASQEVVQQAATPAPSAGTDPNRRAAMLSRMGWRAPPVPAGAPATDHRPWR